MIRLVTLDPFDDEDLALLSKTLFQAFGLGTEHGGSRPLPSEAMGRDGRFDALRIVSEVEPIKTFADDKVLYLTSAPLSLPAGPLGEPPCWSFAQYGGQRAVLSTSRFPSRGVTEASIEQFRRRLAREAIHAIGHEWDLHHCYDARCAMHPPWSPGLAADPAPELCGFCRDKSERRIRMGGKT